VTSPPPLIPAPESIELHEGVEFVIEPDTSIAVNGPESRPVGEYLAGVLRKPTGYPLPLAIQPGGVDNTVSLTLTRGRRGRGGESYSLGVGVSGIDLAADTPEGLFRGVQTLRQLLPAAIEKTSDGPSVAEPWTVPGVRIEDRPRWGWRGSMLDVARHFIPVAGVKRHIELACRYKLNMLHLHLTDDQGWRIHVDRWPRLSRHGGRLQVGGTSGGYYTKDEYREIVSYAAERHMTVVPEIDMPGHTHAALASYPQLNCDGRPRSLYTGTDVRVSSLCIGKEVTDRFVEEVLAEIAELTPGPYLHVGGDEASQTSPEDYVAFIKRVEEIILAQGKTMVAWEEAGRAGLAAGSLVQFWNNGSGAPSGFKLARSAVERGQKLVMSPSDRAYLDMKYDITTELGTQWAGFVDVRRAYDWDPSQFIAQVDESDIAGIEAPIWTETIADVDSLEFMVWPRLAGIAELGWSPTGRSWDEYRMRLAAHGPRWEAIGVNFFRSPHVPWRNHANES